MPITAYFDCFAGISGDMCLGALIDAGWPVERLQATIHALKLEGVSATIQRVTKHGISGTQVTINIPPNQPQRHLSDLESIIHSADLPAEVQTRALSVIRLLGEVESRVHNVPIDEIHFHEIGAVDTLVDIVGTITALHDLKVESIYSAPLPWSHGTINTAHGILPVPPPAVVALLQGLPVVGVDVEGEMVTPTGAALIRSLVQGFGTMPSGQIQRTGYGAGTRDWPDRANLLRIVIVESQGSGLTVETLAILSCNIDDMNPQWYGPLMQLLLDSGALDVWLTPVQMKKNRPGTVIDVLCKSPDAASLRDLLLHHTTTLGVRQQAVTRYAVDRQIETVQTEYGPVRVKVAFLPDGSRRSAPEHDDCAALAAQHGVPIREIWLAALQTFPESR
jgi:uncharacterized protein (TIGR00299 family) protein